MEELLVQVEEQADSELYIKAYDHMTPAELQRVADMALQRREGWKLREISDFAHQRAEEYAQISFASIAHSDQIETKV